MILPDGRIRVTHEAGETMLIVGSIAQVNSERKAKVIEHEWYSPLMDVQDVTLIFADADARQRYTELYSEKWREKHGGNN